MLVEEKRCLFEQKFQLFTSFMMRMGYKLARASVQGRVVLTRKMFLGRPVGGQRQSHTGSRLLLPACLAGAAQATALALHTGGKQHEIVQDWRIPAKKGRSSTPLSTSPTSVSTQRLRLHTTYDSL